MRARHRMEWADPRIQASLAETGDRITATLAVAAPALWVWLELEKGGPVFLDNLFDMRPGVSKAGTFKRPPDIPL